MLLKEINNFALDINFIFKTGKLINNHVQPHIVFSEWRANGT